VPARAAAMIGGPDYNLLLQFVQTVA
jgi:hypothetical protein